MTIVADCTNCGRRSPNAPICTTCIDHMIRDLRRAPSDILDLSVASARLDKTASRVGGRSSGTPLPIRPDIAAVLDHADSILGSWARDLAERNHVCAAPHTLRVEARRARQAERTRRIDPAALEQFPIRTAELVAVWMVGIPTVWITRHPAVEDLHDELTDVLAEVRLKMDRTETRWYGRCACEADLLGDRDGAVVTCRACGTQYLAETLRARMLADARDRLATGAEIRALIEATTGKEVSRSLWDSWVARKRIRPRGWVRPDGSMVAVWVHRNDPGLYRIGDALDLASRRKASA